MSGHHDPAAVPVVSVHDLFFAYEPGRPVLAGAELALYARHRLAVLGPNGGGKTTLFRLIVGALKPDAGEIRLDGRPLRHTRKGLLELRQQVQLVVQDPDDQLFAASVYQDVSFGPVNLGLPAPEVRARVDAALGALGITELADRPTHLLSFGQKKRTAIAGAIAMCPRVLVLDEPTAGLDPAGIEALLATLHDLHVAGTTLVISTHDVDLAYRWSDEVAIVADGTIHRAPVDVALADHDLLTRARLGPAWAPTVHTLLERRGGLSGARPQTAAELYALLDTATRTIQPSSHHTGGAGAGA
jgi:cobalt/nickel transport system ATP-binding protein